MRFAFWLLDFKFKTGQHLSPILPTDLSFPIFVSYLSIYLVRVCVGFTDGLRSSSCSLADKSLYLVNLDRVMALNCILAFRWSWPLLAENLRNSWNSCLKATKQIFLHTMTMCWSWKQMAVKHNLFDIPRRIGLSCDSSKLNDQLQKQVKQHILQNNTFIAFLTFVYINISSSFQSPCPHAAEGVSQVTTGFLQQNASFCHTCARNLYTRVSLPLKNKFNFELLNS